MQVWLIWVTCRRGYFYRLFLGNSSWTIGSRSKGLYFDSGLFTILLALITVSSTFWLIDKTATGGTIIFFLDEPLAFWMHQVRDRRLLCTAPVPTSNS